MPKPKRKKWSPLSMVSQEDIPSGLLGDTDDEIQALLDELIGPPLPSGWSPDGMYGPQPKAPVASRGVAPGPIEGSRLPGFMAGHPSRPIPPSTSPLSMAGPRGGIPGGARTASSAAAGAGAGGLMALAGRAALPLAVAYGASELAGGILPYFIEPKSVREDRKLQKEAMRNEALANAMLLQTTLSAKEKDRLNTERLERREDKKFREVMAQQERTELARQALMSMALDNEQLAMMGAGGPSPEDTRSRIDRDLARLAATSGGSGSPWELLGLR